MVGVIVVFAFRSLWVSNVDRIFRSTVWAVLREVCERLAWRDRIKKYRRENIVDIIYR